MVNHFHFTRLSDYGKPRLRLDTMSVNLFEDIHILAEVTQKQQFKLSALDYCRKTCSKVNVVR